MLTTMAQRLLIATTVCCAVTGAATAQAQDPPQGTAYDDEMFCRFVIHGDGGSWNTDDSGNSRFEPFWQPPDPGELANTTGVGGYYWATSYHLEDDGSSSSAINQFWFYRWTTYEDDARQDKGMGVIFAPDKWDEDGRVARWVAARAYTVGFNSYMNEAACARRFPDPDAGNGHASKLIPMTTMSRDDCSFVREHILDSPHAAPPGCE
jgi:hypothetical protein